MRVVGGALVVDETNIARTPAEMRAATATSSSSAPLTADDASRGELEGLTEIAREKLWQHAWAAVRSCVCFDRQGSELPLHICQHLKDLYNGGIDGEFRYSQNMKSLLDMVVVLARPRIGVNISAVGGAASAASSSFTTENGASADAIRALQVNAKMNKIAEAQLVRGVVALLRSIAPVDIAAFSALVTAISELAFGRSYLEMSFDINNFNSAGQAIGAVHTRCFVLGPVDPKLRTEVGEYLMAILEARSRPAPAAAATSNGDDSTAVAGLPLVFYDLPPSWLSTCLEIVVRYFVGELCVRPSMQRSNFSAAALRAAAASSSASTSSSSSPSKGGASSAPADRSGLLASTRSNSLSGGSSIGNFFSSIGRLIATLEEDEDDEEVDEEERLKGAAANLPDLAAANAVTAESDFRHKMVSGGSAAGRAGVGAAAVVASDVLCVHSLKPLRALEGAFCSQADTSLSWCPFPATSTDLKLLRTLFSAGLACAFIPAAGGVVTSAASKRPPETRTCIRLTHKQQSMWSHILAILLCVSSPWKHAELVPAAATAASATQDANPSLRPASLPPPPPGSSDESLVNKVPTVRAITAASSSSSTPLSPPPPPLATAAAAPTADSPAALGSSADGVAFASVLTPVIDTVIAFCIEFR